MISNNQYDHVSPLHFKYPIPNYIVLIRKNIRWLFQANLDDEAQFEKFLQLNYELLKRVLLYDHDINNTEENDMFRRLKPRKRLHIKAYFDCLFDDINNTKVEMTPGRKARINDMLRMYWKIAAPKPKYRDYEDRFIYHIMYLGAKLGNVFDEENTALAEEYLSKFNAADIKQMQQMDIHRS